MKHKLGGRVPTHNQSGSKATGKPSLTYNTWISMKQRCYYEKNISYPYYGGCGITVCKRWVNSFENFLEDMGERPEGRTLDRKNTKGNYCKKNCRWATWKEQNNNKQTGCVYVTCKGKRQSLTAWANELGVRQNLFSSRIRDGLTPFEAVIKTINSLA